MEFLYNAIAVNDKNEALSIDIEKDQSWLKVIEGQKLLRFLLVPKENIPMPVVEVDLSPLAGGYEKRLIYFSRVIGRVEKELKPCARLYALGWHATVEEKSIRSITWIYPNGSVVIADEPPYLEELIEKEYARLYGGQVNDNA
jgi:hypothetical protein